MYCDRCLVPACSSKPRGADVLSIPSNPNSPLASIQCELPSEQVARGRGRDPNELRRLHQPLLKKLGEILGCCAPELCQEPGGALPDKCELHQLPDTGESPAGVVESKWDDDRWYVTFQGMIYAGKYFAEWLELEFLNGASPFAWGKATGEEVSQCILC